MKDGVGILPGFKATQSLRRLHIEPCLTYCFSTRDSESRKGHQKYQQGGHYDTLRRTWPRRAPLVRSGRCDGVNGHTAPPFPASTPDPSEKVAVATMAVRDANSDTGHTAEGI